MLSRALFLAILCQYCSHCVTNLKNTPRAALRRPKRCAIIQPSSRDEATPMKQTTLCYIQRDGQYLMLHRTKKKNDENHDKWIGIGGHIEPGETPEQCILRECLEETGLLLLDCRPRGIVHFRSDVYPDEDMHLFTATRFEGEQISCDEGELAWIDKGRLLALTLWEGDRVFLRLLDTRRDFFDLTLEYRGETLVRAALDGGELDLKQY